MGKRKFQPGDTVRDKNHHSEVGIVGEYEGGRYKVWGMFGNPQRGGWYRPSEIVLVKEAPDGQ